MILKDLTLTLLSCILFTISGFTEGIDLESKNIAVRFSDNGVISFTDKKQEVDWTSSFVGWVNLKNEKHSEKIPLVNSQFNFYPSPDTMYFEFKGIEGQLLSDKKFLMQGYLIIHNDKLIFELTGINTSLDLIDVEYPAHMLTVDSGLKDSYIVVPHLQGIIIPSRYDAGFMRYGQNIWDLIADQEAWWSFESGNLNMPWFGASKNGSSIFVSMTTASDCDLHVIGNAVVGTTGETVNASRGQVPGKRISSLGPIWKSSKNELVYPRRMTIELVDNGYLGMARKYKELAKESGRYVTLREKIEQNPEYQKLIGAPDIKIYCYTNRINNPFLRAWSEPVLNGYSKVNTTFAQVGEMAAELKAMGVEKSMILLAGWNRMGYDREHVDMWPPAEVVGGIEGLRKAAEIVREQGFLFALHDNYDDFYPDAPTYDQNVILKNEDGSIHLGGVWDGGLCHIICPSQRTYYLNRNMDLVQKHIPLNAYYFDVMTNTSHYECYDPQHPITRKADLEYRKKLLANINERGLVVGGERGTDWALPYVGFCEGLSGGGNDYHRGIGYRIGLTTPLFYLVYRECVVGYWQHGTPHGREDHANHVLLDLLYAQPSSWSIEYQQWGNIKYLIRDVYELLGKFHQKTAHESMSDHQILTEDYMVQQTKFSNGSQVIVNFGIVSYEAKDITIPPKGFLIKVPGEEIILGTVERNIRYINGK